VIQPKEHIPKTLKLHKNHVRQIALASPIPFKKSHHISHVTVIIPKHVTQHAVKMENSMFIIMMWTFN
jgi:hypothetical protein